jgi:hypothetical protein
VEVFTDSKVIEAEINRTLFIDFRNQAAGLTTGAPLTEMALTTFTSLGADEPVVRKVIDERLTHFEKNRAKYDSRFAAYSKAMARITRNTVWFKESLMWSNMFPKELQPCEKPHAQDLRKANADDRVCDSADILGTIQTLKYQDSCQTFVVQHDWFEPMMEVVLPIEDELRPKMLSLEDFPNVLTKTDQQSQFKLPYPACFFDFVVSGVKMTLVAVQMQDCMPVAALFVEKDGDWFAHQHHSPTTKYEDSTFCKLWRQVISICIMLEAKVVATSTVGGSKKINDARRKVGKLPLPTYRVVNLSRRLADEKKGEASEYKGVRRLHFRRGHWRKYEQLPEPKWIEWMLVGNPDLGFIDKHYRL